MICTSCARPQCMHRFISTGKVSSDLAVSSLLLYASPIGVLSSLKTHIILLELQSLQALRLCILAMSCGFADELISGFRYFLHVILCFAAVLLWRPFCKISFPTHQGPFGHFLENYEIRSHDKRMVSWL